LDVSFENSISSNQ